MSMIELYLCLHLFCSLATMKWLMDNSRDLIHVLRFVIDKDEEIGKIPDKVKKILIAILLTLLVTALSPIAFYHFYIRED